MWEDFISWSGEYKDDQYYLLDTLVLENAKGTLDKFFLEFHDRMFPKKG